MSAENHLVVMEWTSAPDISFGLYPLAVDGADWPRSVVTQEQWLDFIESGRFPSVEGLDPDCPFN